MGKIWKKQALALGVLGAVSLPSSAQDTPTGIVMEFGVDQRFQYNSNLGLNPNGEDGSFTSATELSFNLSSETAIDRLNFSASTTHRIVDGPRDFDNGFDGVNARFRWQRDVGHSDLSLSARYFTSSIEFSTLFGEVDEDGNLIADTDEVFTGTGRRTNYNLGFETNLMKDGPLTLQFRGNYARRDYEDVISTTLVDNERYTFGATATLEFSEVLDGTLDYQYDDFTSEDLDLTERESERLTFQLGYDVSETLRVTGLIGTSRVESTTGIGAARGTRVEDGFVYGVGVVYERPNGGYSLDFTSSIDQDGRRDELVLGRSYEFKDGQLAFAVGYAREDNGDDALTADIQYQKELPNGIFDIRYRRGIASDANDVNRLTQALSAGYSYELNDFSSLDFNASYASQENTNGTSKSERAELGATYSYELTEDWSLNTGYLYRMRNGATSSSANDHSVFVSLGRRFSIRP